MALPPAGPLPQPKFLSEVTVPTGGWQFKIYLSNAADYDKTVTVTIPAGDYFVAWDAQSDDFLWKLSDLLNTAIYALGGTFAAGGGRMTFEIGASTHKVKFGFDGTHYATAQKRKVKLAWTELNGSDVAGVLGFDSSADDISTAVNYPTFTADWHHAYGFYADDDGLIEDDLTVDENMPDVVQSVSPASGHVKTHQLGERFLNRIALVYLPRIKTYSDGRGYGQTPTYPFEKNEPLECWWREAVQGKRFRYYRDGQISSSKAVDHGTHTGSPATNLEDTTKSWETDPQRWPGRLIYIPNWFANAGLAGRWYINSNTATQLVPAHDWAISFNGNPTEYWIMEQPYRTYVLDVEKTKSWAPLEHKPLDEYDFEIALLRYEA